jgi:hypothetical protein
MAMQTGENEQGLKKVIDMTRMISIAILIIHIYYFCYAAFREWHLTATLSDRLLGNISHTGLLSNFHKSKFISLAFLLLSLLGVKGKKDETANYKAALGSAFTGLLLYFISGLFLLLTGISTTGITVIYITVTGLGYILVLTGGSLLTRIIKVRLSSDVFNTDNETFPQEERLLTNEYSVNLPMQYQLKGKTRNGYLNYVNPRRSVLILGGPGSGKSAFIVENFIKQMIEKGYALLVIDWKYPDLSEVAYNHYLKYRHVYKIPPVFNAINFKDAASSAQCNPLAPDLMKDVLDAIQASRTIMLSINPIWANQQGQFFVESPINFLAAIFWFLKKYKNGKFCTLPHAIELAQLEYDKLFTILNTEPEISSLISAFISAYLSDIMETVENQIASARIPLGRLASPDIYYILSGMDFPMDINNPAAPKITCLGNDPVKADALAPIISLICDRAHKIINQKGKLKCGLIYEEFAQIRVPSIQTVVATGRGHDIVPVIVLQDYSQLKRVYTRDEAESIFNMAGNIISGQVSGETAKLLSERFPKIMQDRQSLSINSSDTSVSKSKQLDASIQPATIASLSAGEFVGIVADNPDQPIKLKAFHARIINDFEKVNKEKAAYLPIPAKQLPDKKVVIQQRYLKIKQEALAIYDDVMEELINDPAREYLIIKK